MPFVQVHTSRTVPAIARRELGAAIAKAYGEHMQTTHRIVNVAYTFYEKHDVARYDAENDAAQEMTVISCDVRAGRSPAALEALGRALSELCARHLDIPVLRVAVYVTEHPSYQIYRDGGPAPDWSTAEGNA